MRQLRVLLAVAALVLVGAPAVAAGDATGTLRVSVEDVRGPAAGLIAVLPVDGEGKLDPDLASTGESTHDFVLPPGQYAVVALTPWGGLDCVGVFSCSWWPLVYGQVMVSGVVDVAAGATSTYVLAAPAPATVEIPSDDPGALEVVFSEEMAGLASYLTGAAEFGTPSAQWLRDGLEIPGADRLRYRPVAEDAEAQLSVRLTYHDFAVVTLRRSFGADAGPIVLDASVPDRRASDVTARLRPATVRRDERSTLVARVQDGTGRVRVEVGDRRRSCTLADGACEVRLPRLAPGRYPVTATYLGSSELLPGTAAPLRLTVRK
jgi:hypothetical protein